MSINLFTNERITYLLDRVTANAQLLPQVEFAWAEAARSVNTIPEEQALIEAEFREAWRDLMQRYQWLAEQYEAQQMWPPQREKFESLRSLLGAHHHVMRRLNLTLPRDTEEESEAGDGNTEPPSPPGS